MERYFMTVSEASLLVINASLLSEGGEVFLLDMGKPIKIDELVRNLIKLQGFIPDKEIEIKYTGLKKGEKLIEELLTNKEKCLQTINHKIFISGDSFSVKEEQMKRYNYLKKNIHYLARYQVRTVIREIYSRIYRIIFNRKIFLEAPISFFAIFI